MLAPRSGRRAGLQGDTEDLRKIHVGGDAWVKEDAPVSCAGLMFIGPPLWGQGEAMVGWGRERLHM